METLRYFDELRPAEPYFTEPRDDAPDVHALEARTVEMLQSFVRDFTVRGGEAAADLDVLNRVRALLLRSMLTLARRPRGSDQPAIDDEPAFASNREEVAACHSAS